MSTPTLGQPLPRAAEAYTTPEKWTDWILADRGHGLEWARVFSIGPSDTQAAWRAIADAVLDAPIHTIIDRGGDGLVCGVDVELTIGSRTANVRTSWNYTPADAPPRLVTAFPRL
jgi:hypothetical protein